MNFRPSKSQNLAQQGRRRTYRAHGRIGPYCNCLCQREMVLQEKEDSVEKPDDEVKRESVTKRQLAKRRLRIGGGQ